MYIELKCIIYQVPILLVRMYKDNVNVLLILIFNNEIFIHMNAANVLALELL